MLAIRAGPSEPAVSVAKAMQVQAGKTVTIETMIGCRIDGKEPWIPKVKKIGNAQVMLVSKWDRGFTKFLTGKSLDLTKSSMSLNSTSAGAYIDELVRRRRVACEAAVLEANSTDENEKENRCKAKKRRVTVTDSMSVIKPLVDITLPAVTEPAMPERIVKCAFNTGHELWVEVNETTLLQIVLGIQECGVTKGRTRKARKGDAEVKEEPKSPSALRDDDDDVGGLDISHLDTYPYGSHLHNMKREAARVNAVPVDS